MTARFGALLGTLALLCGLASLAPVEGGELESGKAIEVRLNPMVALGPVNVEAWVRVAQHEDNRRLRIAIESPAYYRGTEIYLDGGNAPTSHSVSWVAVPPGEYICIVAVYGSDGERHRVEHRGLTIIGEP